jgi:hypothetical protein
MTRSNRIILAVLAIVLLAVGCRTQLMLSNRPDPENFPPFVFAGTSGQHFGTLSFDPPSEMRDEEYEIVKIDIFATVYADTIYATSDYDLEVDIYLSLDDSPATIDDPDVSEYITTVRIEAQGERYLIETHNPRLIHEAVRQEEFYLKGVVRLTSAEPMAGRVRIDDVYFEALLERDTSGLIPFLYLF